jgi:protein-tyrosine-phosphatase
MKKVLFIGSGKSYRSKFAEAFFNNLGKLECLFMLNTHGMGRYPSSRYPCAYNSGVDLKKSTKKLNKKSEKACKEHLMLPTHCYDEFHRKLTSEDFAWCDYIIVMNSDEHREFLEEKFADHADKIIYWELPKKKKYSRELIEDIKDKVRELYEEASQKGKKQKK